MTTDNIAKLADDYAQIKLQIEALEEQIKVVKKQIIATGRDVIIGEDFKVTVSLQERPTISTKKAEEILEPEIYAKLVNIAEYEVVRYKAIAH